jgi:hypothetical protein
MSRTPEQKLWDQLRKHTSDLVDWTRIETGATTQGVPDLDGVFKGQNIAFLQGHEFKLELKVCKTKSAKMSSLWRPMQIAWQQRRTSLGGNVWNLVHHPSGSSLYLYHGSQLIQLVAGEVVPEPYLRVSDDKVGYQVSMQFIKDQSIRYKVGSPIEDDRSKVSRSDIGEED